MSRADNAREASLGLIERARNMQIGPTRFGKGTTLEEVSMPSLVRFTVFSLAAALCASAPARALSVQLNTEFDAGTIGNHLTLTVNPSGGALDFVLSLAGTDLGVGADLHEFYFNLVGTPTNVQISNTNAPTTAYSLSSNPSVAGGAGSSFEYGVSFGNGASGRGNGVLKTASFRISANQPLTLASLAVTSSTSSGIVVNFAAHLQGTSFVSGATSETVGGVIPEPSTLLLVTTGLLGLAYAGGARTPAPSA